MNQTQKIEPANAEIIPDEGPVARVVNFRKNGDLLSILRVLLAGLYRTLVAGGSLVLVWQGASPWLLLLALPFLILGPRSR